MTEANEQAKFERLVHEVDSQSKLLRIWQMEGGISAQVTALEIEQANGQLRKMIVRRHGAVDLQHNPQIAADEFKLLQVTRSAGLATPALYYVDPLGDIFSTPCIVVEYIEGQPEFTPTDLGAYIRQFALHLSSIHRVDCSNADLSFLPQHAERYAAKLSEPAASEEGRIREALQSVWPLPQMNPFVLLHGDYWPGNILWRNDQLVGIIDWEDAAIGDPLADLANSRLEILWAFGIDSMQHFTRGYQSMTSIVDFDYLPYWDLCVALRQVGKIAGFGVDAASEKTMRERLDWFVDQAFEQLNVS
jgi:aminoglycoside phosphotransferase (APT) family kinase protein